MSPDHLLPNSIQFNRPRGIPHFRSVHVLADNRLFLLAQHHLDSLMRLLDTRFAGVARGVGTAKILGRIHSAQIKLNDLYLPVGFSVLEVRISYFSPVFQQLN